MKDELFRLGSEHLELFSWGRRWAYFADETRSFYLVPYRAVLDLGRALQSGQPDAYSNWCSAQGGRPVSKRTAARMDRYLAGEVDLARAKTSMRTALKLDGVRRALNGLIGCPAGGWGETEQALRRIKEELPLRADRDWTVSDIVEKVTYLDHAGRYQLR